MIARDLIAQIATPPGEGALAVVRMSGIGAHDLLKRVFRPAKSIDFELRRAMHGEVVSTTDGEPIDDVIAVAFAEGASYTGEEMAEISCHGGMVIVRCILSLLCDAGARPAAPGEFTKRAYLNGRLDLAQAEAVCGLIRARSETAARASLRQLRGVLSEKTSEVRNALVSVAAEIEASLDFPDEDASSIAPEDLPERLEPILGRLRYMLRTAPMGRAVRDGVTVVLLGRPNTGKSSILNAVLGRDRAIVTPSPGTTRDTLEEWTDLDGDPVRMIDTAGLRAPADAVERIGVERAARAGNESDIVVAVLDGSAPMTEEDEAVLSRARGGSSTWIACINKSDLPERGSREAVRRRVQDAAQVVDTCALRPDGVRSLLDAISGLLRSGSVEPGEVLLTGERHVHCVREAAECLERALGGTRDHTPMDVLAFDVREAAEHLDAILGHRTTDDVIESVFATFCLGK